MSVQQSKIDYGYELQAQNNQWCNKRLLDACERLSDEEYHASRQSFFGSIHATLVHIAYADQLFLWRLKRLPIEDLPELNDFNSYRRYQKKLDQELLVYVASLTPEDLEEKISFFMKDDGIHINQSRARLLILLSNHQIHHRGQVHDMLSQTSIKPPQLDEFYFN